MHEPADGGSSTGGSPAGSSPAGSLTGRLNKFRQELAYRAISTVAWIGVRLLCLTLRIRVSGDEQVIERTRLRQPSIIVVWHGRTLVCTNYYGKQHWLAMISLSRDGEFQSRIFQKFGWKVVPGSSGRGGVRALVSTLKHLREGTTLAFTPDGPKGPSHRVHPGVLFMSQKAACPIYPLGMSAYPRWLMKSWDRYQIPKPFGRAAIIYGEPIQVPPNAGPEEIERISMDLARTLCDLERQAEALVTPEVRRFPCEPAARLAEELSGQAGENGSL